MTGGAVNRAGSMPHYVREYRQLVRFLRSRTDSVEAAGLGVEQVIKELVYGHYVMIARHEP